MITQGMLKIAQGMLKDRFERVAQRMLGDHTGDAEDRTRDAERSL